jgi:L-ascorbate metabolism protein UlaG (beta-lactamase superfamily)
LRRPRARHSAFLIGVLSFAIAGCAHQYLDPRLYGQVREPPPDTTSSTVQVRFLGVGGFIIQRGDDVVLTAPFYTNPPEGFLAGLTQVHPNEALISSLLPERWAEKAVAILVGHTHYDHFMDVPYIAKAIAKDAVLYGSKTMKQLAMAPPYAVGADKIVVVSDVEGEDHVDYRRCAVNPAEGCNHGPGSGDWIKINDRVRIRALCSRHAGPRTWTGCLNAVPGEPTRVGDWKLGDTYAFLVDFLDATGNPDFRVYYQDTATPPTYGYVPEQLVLDKAVDVALLCGAGFNYVHQNPVGIVKNSNPRYVVFGHWESFFKPQTRRPLETLAYFDYSDLVDRMEALAKPAPTGISWPGQFWIAAPGNLFVFEPQP